MRIHPFGVVKISGNYPAQDLEYIADYPSSFNIRKQLFQRVCQIDNHTESALVAGAVTGYLEDDTFGAVKCYPHPNHTDLSVPNKGYIALWAENTYGLDGIVVWGIYRHDECVYLVKARADDLLTYIKTTRVYWSDRFLVGLAALKE